MANHTVVQAFLRTQAQQGEDFPRHPLFQRVFEFGVTFFIVAALPDMVVGEVVENLLHLFGVAAVKACVGGLVEFGEGEQICLRLVNRQGKMVLGEVERQGDEGAGGIGFLRSDAFVWVGNDGLQGGEAEALLVAAEKEGGEEGEVAIVYADIGNARSAGEVVAYIAHGKEIGFCHHGAEQAFAWSLQKFGKRDAQFHAQIVDDLGGGVADFTVLLQKVVIPAVGERGGALADVFVQIAAFALIVFAVVTGSNVFNQTVKIVLHGGGGFFAHFLLLN